MQPTFLDNDHSSINLEGCSSSGFTNTGCLAKKAPTTESSINNAKESAFKQSNALLYGEYDHNNEVKLTPRNPGLKLCSVSNRQELLKNFNKGDFGNNVNCFDFL